MVDQRDTASWVVVELTHVGEQRVVEGTLEPVLRQDLRVGPEHPVFIPCVQFRREGRVSSIHLMEGYAFVGSGLAETSYFRLERQPYVAQILSTTQGPHRLRTLSVVTDSHIRGMRKKLQDLVSAEIPLESRVLILEGTYRNLQGVVKNLDQQGDMAYVHITLRTLEILATIPRVFLQKTDDT